MLSECWADGHELVNKVAKSSSCNQAKFGIWVIQALFLMNGISVSACAWLLLDSCWHCPTSGARGVLNWFPQKILYSFFLSSWNSFNDQFALHYWSKLRMQSRQRVAKLAGLVCWKGMWDMLCSKSSWVATHIVGQRSPIWVNQLYPIAQHRHSWTEALSQEEHCFKNWRYAACSDSYDRGHWQFVHLHTACSECLHDWKGGFNWQACYDQYTSLFCTEVLGSPQDSKEIYVHVVQVVGLTSNDPDPSNPFNHATNAFHNLLNGAINRPHMCQIPMSFSQPLVPCVYACRFQMHLCQRCGRWVPTATQQHWLRGQQDMMLAQMRMAVSQLIFDRLDADCSRQQM